jgi:hypothetical protein
MSLFGLFKRKKEYVLPTVEYVDFDKSDKWIIQVGDKDNYASEKDLKKIVEEFEKLKNGKSNILTIGAPFKLTIVREETK